MSALDPLFADDRVDLDVLRQRAHNYRWAEVEEDVIPLTAADSDFPIAAEIRGAMAAYIDSGYMSYGPNHGLPIFRATVAETLARRRGIPCAPAAVFAANSAASAMFLVAKALLQPGDEVLIADPVDFLFERSVVAAGGIVRRFAVDLERGMTVDVDAVEALIGPRTRMIAICNPHNPLGRVWSREELAALAELALRHDLQILSDEVWSDVVFDAPMISVAALSPEIAARTHTVYGFSKGYGLAGLRLGVVLCPSPAAAERLAEISHADATAYGVATLSQIAGVAALTRGGAWQRRFVAHLRAQRDLAVERLNAMPGVRCHAPEGTFVVFPEITGLGLELDEAALAERIREEARVAVVPGSPAFFGPGAAGHLRLSLATSRGLLTEALDRLEAWIRRERREPRSAAEICGPRG
ncbi:MAG: aminotransferase class I/II-fold pyridoxal phosphate-dependent enzyme [Nannocystaceae bacterium]